MKALGELAGWAAVLFLLFVALCVLTAVLWMLPGWIRRFCFRLEWRRQAPSRSYWRAHPSGPLDEWEKQVRRG